MKYRVMDSEGNMDDFDKEADAYALFTAKKIDVTSVRPTLTSCHYHRCYHDEIPFRPCEIIEEVHTIASGEPPLPL